MARSTVETSTEPVVDLTEKKPIPVLHVDDDSVFLKVAKQCLEMQGGFQVDPALSVNEAMEKMKTKTYDVIICDYAMPEKDGLEFLKELRDTGNSIPFIMFTGKGREEVEITAFNFGADRYFNKIGAPETVYGELAHGIRQVVESKRAGEALRESENYLKAILASIVTGVVVVDAETHEIVDANSKALETIGASREHVIGKVCHKFICLGEKGKCPISDLGQTEDRAERVFLRADGGRIPILRTVVTITWKGRKYMVESFVDITERKRAERALLESHEKFERLFVNSPEAGVYVDSNFLMLDANPRFSELFGYSLDEIKGKRLLDLIVPEDKKDEGEMLDRKAKEAYTYQDTVRKRKDGTLVTVSISAAPITVGDQPVGYVGLYRDITEMKRYEKSLSELNIYGRNLNTARSMGEIYELTLDAAEKILGFEFADIFIIEGKMLNLVTHRGHSKISSLALPMDGGEGVSVRAARTGKPILVPDISKEKAYVEGGLGARSELAVPIKIGNRVLGVLNIESRRLDAFSEKDQELLEILASHAATAISNLDRARKLETYAREILESQQRFERLFMNNPEAAVYVGPDFHILDINPRFAKLFGYSLDEVKGKHINDVVVPKDKMKEAEMLDKKGENGCVYHDTVRKRKDGSLVPVSISIAPITFEGRLIGTVGLYRDITERQRYEESLSALNTYSRNLNTADNMGEIYRLTLDAIEKTLGFEYAVFMVVDKNMLCVVDQCGYSESFSSRLPLDGNRGVTVKAAKTGRPILVLDTEKEGTYVEFMSGIRSELAVPVKIARRVLGVLNVESKILNGFDEKDQELLEILASHAATAISNITKRYEIERYSTQLASLMRSSAEMIHTTDLYKRLQSILEAIRELGWRRVGIRLTDENLDTRSPKDTVSAGFTDEEREFAWKNRAPGQLWRERFGREGERFKIGEFYFFPWSDPWVRRIFSQSMVPSKLPLGELGEWDPRDSLSAPLRLADGRIVGILGMDDPSNGKRPTEESLAPLELFLHQAAVAIENAQLIQQQKEYMGHLEEKVEERTRQLKQAQEQLIKSERLAAIGQVAAMVGHDLRNPLTGIAGATYYLRTKLRSNANQKTMEMLDLIEKDVEHSNNIITDLLEYSREIRLETAETNTKSIVKDALSLVKFFKNIQVLDFTSLDPKIVVDVEKIKRVFLNIIKNAVDAMPEGGTLTITSKESNGTLQVAFTDTGTGISKDALEKLWTPFFTTKSRGMGLGLPICKRFVEAHGGNVSVESTVGKGTTFTVTIPIRLKQEGGEKTWVKVPESSLLTTTKA